MIIVDASAVVDILLDLPHRSRLDEQLRSADETFAPELLLVEVSSALWRLRRADEVDDGAVQEALGSLGDFPVTLVSHELLLDGAWQLRHTLRITDAYYVALAAHLGAPLLTTDLGLARGASGVDVITVT